MPEDVWTFEGTINERLVKFQVQGNKDTRGYLVKGAYYDEKNGRVPLTGRVEDFETPDGKVLSFTLYEDTNKGRFEVRFKRDFDFNLIAEAYYYHPLNPTPEPLQVDTATLALREGKPRAPESNTAPEESQNETPPRASKRYPN